jgi:hypothetical protein
MSLERAEAGRLQCREPAHGESAATAPAESGEGEEGAGADGAVPGLMPRGGRTGA